VIENFSKPTKLGGEKVDPVFEPGKCWGFSNDMSAMT
jgi:hypothetical protein